MDTSIAERSKMQELKAVELEQISGGSMTYPFIFNSLLRLVGGFSGGGSGGGGAW